MKFRRLRGGSFRRRRSGSLYEMQEASFTREPVTIQPGRVATNPSLDLFLMYHPRLEATSSATGPTPAQTMPLNKGVVIRGIRHKLILSYVPQVTQINGTASARGFATIHAAIVRLATDENLQPYTAPNLFEPQMDNPSDATGRQFRVLWRNLYHLAVVDGSLVLSLNTADGTNPYRGMSTVAQGNDGGDTVEPVRTKSAVKLGQDQGLFLQINAVSPFLGGDDIVMGLDYYFVAGVKPLTRGTSYQ